MRKLIAEPIFIFFSVLGSLWVNGYSDDLKKKEELNNSIITLSNEISSNIDYSKEHMFQLKNMLYITNYILDNFDTYNVDELRGIHDNNPFIHRFSQENEVLYIKKYSDFNDKNYFYWSNAWEPDNIFFKSLLNSGELLKIKNKDLTSEIESIYTKQEERISGTFELRNSVTLQMLQWDLKKSLTLKGNQNPLFSSRDKELKLLLKWRKDFLEQSIQSLEDYIFSLNKVVEVISNQYKTID